ncbi:MAG TPA: thylakoid membrane photosystem I accumulation factor [Coleofasciculaceae cyanobacterium]
MKVRSLFSVCMAVVSQFVRNGMPRWASRASVGLVLGLVGCVLLWAPPAWASLTDDRYDGNIFPLYAGNGSLVPPRVTLVESLQLQSPTLLVFYVDDSVDCKLYSSVVSQLDSFYGRAANFVPINVDAIPLKSSYEPTDPGYYYQGFVPQTVLLDQSGKVVFNEKGAIPFEKVDDAFRQVFDLLPRSESVELKRRQVNEVNTELTQ